MSRGLRPGRGVQAELSDALREGHRPNFAARLLVSIGGAAAPFRPGERRPVAPKLQRHWWPCHIHSRYLALDRTCPTPGLPPGSLACARTSALVHVAGRGLVGPWQGLLPPPFTRAEGGRGGCGCEVCAAVVPLPVGADVRLILTNLLPDNQLPRCEE